LIEGKNLSIAPMEAASFFRMVNLTGFKKTCEVCSGGKRYSGQRVEKAEQN
jgi:hypothetical protein